jgi:hypothetical protein
MPAFTVIYDRLPEAVVTNTRPFGLTCAISDKRLARVQTAYELATEFADTALQNIKNDPTLRMRDFELQLVCIHADHWTDRQRQDAKLLMQRDFFGFYSRLSTFSSTSTSTTDKAIVKYAAYSERDAESVYYAALTNTTKRLAVILPSIDDIDNIDGSSLPSALTSSLTAIVSGAIPIPSILERLSEQLSATVHSLNHATIQHSLTLVSSSYIVTQTKLICWQRRAAGYSVNNTSTGAAA